MRAELIFLLMSITISMFFTCACHAQIKSNEVINSCEIKLVLISKGTFVTGSMRNESSPTPAALKRRVEVSGEFYIGTTEVTQRQYAKVMGFNPSDFQGRDVVGGSGDYPVECVSWHDAMEFCERLSSMPEEAMAGRVYRLPTEDEWEFACRAGSEGKFSFGNDENELPEYAWFRDNSYKHPKPVGKKRPNAWGLYDMHGNVWEWCSDCNVANTTDDCVEPVGPREGKLRVYRGGAYYFASYYCRSGCRFLDTPTLRSNGGGFRIVMNFISSSD